MDRSKAESLFAKFMLGEDVPSDEFKSALLLAISDMHKMAEIIDIVGNRK